MKRWCKAFLLGLALFVTVQNTLIPDNSQAAAPVFCVNCGTEVTQLITKLQIIKQLATQAQQLQQQIDMYKNMVTNTLNIPNQIWGNTMRDISQIYSILQQSQALAHTAANLDSQFASRYSNYQTYLSKNMSNADWNNKYNQWSRETSDNALYTLKSLGLQTSQMQDEDATLQQLQSFSQSAQGQMQAIQAGDMLAAQTARQIQKLRQLVTLQIQMQADYLAAQQDKDAAERAATQKFYRYQQIRVDDGERF